MPACGSGDYHVDGLRLDPSTQSTTEGRARHAVDEPSSRRGTAEECRTAERKSNDPRLVRRPTRAAFGLDASGGRLHHALNALLTGETRATTSDFGRVADLARRSAAGRIRDGQFNPACRRRRGTPADDPRASSSCAPRNTIRSAPVPLATGCRWRHGRSRRAWRPPLALRRCICMGEESGESAPSSSSPTNRPLIAAATRDGRSREFAAFASSPARREIPDPQAETR